MAKDKTEKTNVMRLLEQKKLPYTPHDYLATGAVSGVEVAAALGLQLRYAGVDGRFNISILRQGGFTGFILRYAGVEYVPAD